MGTMVALLMVCMALASLAKFTSSRKDGSGFRCWCFQSTAWELRRGQMRHCSNFSIRCSHEFGLLRCWSCHRRFGAQLSSSSTQASGLRCDAGLYWGRLICSCSAGHCCFSSLCFKHPRPSQLAQMITALRIRRCDPRYRSRFGFLLVWIGVYMTVKCVKQKGPSGYWRAGQRQRERCPQGAGD